MTRNPVGWFEIYVQDMDRAKAFYENVLSRTLEALAPPGADSSDMEMWAFPMQPEAGGAAGALVHKPAARWPRAAPWCATRCRSAPMASSP